MNAHRALRESIPIQMNLLNVKVVQLANLLLSEEKPALLLPMEPGSTSHRGVSRLKKVLEEPELSRPVEQLLLPGSRRGEGGSEPLGDKRLPHCWRELTSDCRFYCLSVKAVLGNQIVEDEDDDA